MGSTTCSFCGGTGTVVSEQTHRNQAPGGSTHITTPVSRMCATCAGSGSTWTPDPPRTHVPGQNAGRVVKAGEKADRKPGFWGKLLGVLGFFVILGLLQNAAPDMDTWVAIGLSLFGGMVIAAYWKALLLIGVVAFFIWG